MDEEQIQELREDLQEQLQNCDSGLDERSWGFEEGILLTKRSAQYLLSLIEAHQIRTSSVCLCKEPLQFYEHDKHCSICNKKLSVEFLEASEQKNKTK